MRGFAYPLAMQDPNNLRDMGKARRMAAEVYRATGRLPTTERYGLSVQMRRAAISVGSNIAEGCGRYGNRELVQFLQIALGSATELEFQAQIAVELGLLNADDSRVMVDRITEVKKMLVRLIQAHRGGSGRVKV